MRGQAFTGEPLDSGRKDDWTEASSLASFLWMLAGCREGFDVLGAAAKTHDDRSEHIALKVGRGQT